MLALLAYIAISLALFCCKISTYRLKFVIALIVLGSLNFSGRDLVSKSAVCQTCEKVPITDIGVLDPSLKMS